MTRSNPAQAPADEPFGKRFEARVRRQVARRGAFAYLIATTAIVALLSGTVARLTAPDDFQTYGDSVWWALVTLTTVGYGDIVPHTAWGRVIGAFVMVCGVTFMSFLTAIVTSIFIASDEDNRDLELQRREAEIRATLAGLDARLAAIDERLRERS